MKDEIKLIIADDHPIFRSGLKQAIQEDHSFKVVAEASDGETALRFVLEHQPDIVILDIDMPRLSGFQVAEELKKKQIPTAIIFLTMHDDEAMFDKAMALDVKGYVLKDSAPTDIINCLNAVATGKRFTSPAITGYLFKRTASGSDKFETLSDLTSTERRILKLVAEYKTSKEIADELFISHRTVENYRTNICSKLGLHGSHALIKYALQHLKEL